MNEIEKILKEKVVSYEEGKMYLNQWEIVKNAVPRVLTTISHYFPHFSLHDETHSIAILNNIVRIVGVDSLTELSTVDLWMLLVAAYYHDLGMSITREDIFTFLEGGSKFIEYVHSLQKDTKSSLHIYADAFEIKEDKLYYKYQQLTRENVDAHRFLIADFVRKQHASRSAEKVIADEAMHLPGSPIPERIIKMVAMICDAHTKSRKDLMNLPVIESSGCGVEDCHPLYIACLLRIGDLLDVDSNRVSDVLLSTLSSIPSDSKIFNQTNRDITHITINQSVIELTAECKDYKVAELLNSWFKMINDEVSFQTKEWYKISPNHKFRTLPAVGELTVKLKGFDDITGKDRPRFQIEAKKAIEMLQGSGLYNDASQSIRELLQNSVDATYLRIFKEYNDSSESMSKFKEYCSNFPISISLTRKNSKIGFSVWHVEIEDKGIGMERSEMKFITQTGSSSQNKVKQSIIEEMPAWMRPSGTFGIGFQSVFLITDEVKLRTRKWGKEETIELTMYNPSGTENGNILSRTIQDDKIPFGTKIEFDVQSKISNNWTINSTERVAIEEVSTYDFAVDEEMDVTVAKLVDSVVKFANIVDVDIILTYKGNTVRFNQKAQNDRCWFYDSNTGMQVAMGTNNVWKCDSCLYFRNQIVDKYSPHIDFLRFDVNMLTEDAKNVLELSRNDVRPEARFRVRNNMIKSICRYVIKIYEKLDDTYKPFAAALLETNRGVLEEAKIDCSYPDDWKLLILKTDKNGDKRIEDLLAYDKIVFESIDNDNVSFFNKGCEKPDCEIHMGFVRNQYELMKFFKSRIAFSHKGFSFTKDGIVMTFDLNDIMIANDAFEQFYKKYLQMGQSARDCIPCTSDYVDLRIKNVSSEWIFNSFGYHNYPIMVSPYVRKGEQNEDVFFIKRKLLYNVNDKVIDYVYEHRYNDVTTREQISKAYETYRSEYQTFIDKINNDNALNKE